MFQSIICLALSCWWPAGVQGAHPPCVSSGHKCGRHTRRFTPAGLGGRHCVHRHDHNGRHHDTAPSSSGSDGVGCCACLRVSRGPWLRMQLSVTEAALWRDAERQRQWQLWCPPERTVIDAESAAADDSGRRWRRLLLRPSTVTVRSDV